MPKIMWIDPISVTAHHGALLAELESVKRADTEVTVRGLDSGPTHLIYGIYEAVVAGPVLDLVVEAEREKFDAAVIGCFYDTSLDFARELSTTVQMVGPCESALAIAGSLGSTYSVIAPQPGRCVRRMEEQVARYGLSDRLRSVRPLGMSVAELAGDKERTLQRVTDVCRRVVEEDGAEVCILGCTMEFGVYREVQERIGVPVIDAVVAPLKYAEMMAETTAFGWTTSRRGLYERPSADDLADSGLAGRFTMAPVSTV